MIYIIKSSPKLIKIGFTNDLQRRLRELQTAHGKELKVLAIFEGQREHERTFHEVFAQYRTIGEWFKLEGDLAAAIRALSNIGPSANAYEFYQNGQKLRIIEKYNRTNKKGLTKTISAWRDKHG